jgi:hypothetical protein
VGAATSVAAGVAACAVRLICAAAGKDALARAFDGSWTAPHVFTVDPAACISDAQERRQDQGWALPHAARPAS